MSALHKSRLFWWFSLPFLLTVLFLSLVGSRLLINPGQITVAPCGKVIMLREYPLQQWLGAEPPIVRYVMTVTPLSRGFNRGYVCRVDNGRGQRYNHDAGRGFGQWSLSTFAQDCLGDEIGYVLDITYNALLFDVIPLRPLRLTEVVLAMPGADVEICKNDR